MTPGERITNSALETRALGRKIASILKSGDLVALHGNLGSGKTVLVQGICSGLEVKDYVTSPTFALIHEYRGMLPVFHFDFYRLTSLEEIQSLDLDYYFQLGICLVEWAERGEKILPASRISVTIRSTPENENMRWIKIVDDREPAS